MTDADRLSAITVQGGQLLLPYAMSDKATAFASVPLDRLLAALKGQFSQIGNFILSIARFFCEY